MSELQEVACKRSNSKEVEDDLLNLCGSLNETYCRLDTFAQKYFDYPCEDEKTPEKKEVQSKAFIVEVYDRVKQCRETKNKLNAVISFLEQEIK